jgi:hypothetical protein
LYVFNTGRCSPHPCSSQQNPDENSSCPSGCVLEEFNLTADEDEITSYMSSSHFQHSSRSLGKLAHNFSFFNSSYLNKSIHLSHVSIMLSNEEISSLSYRCVVEKCAVHSNESCLIHTENNCIPMEDGCR